MAIKRLRAWFTTKGFGNRFANGDQPTKDQFEDLFLTTVMKTETGDRAKPDDGTALQDITGHVVLATDSQAYNRDPQKTDRTVVVAPNNLTNCTAVSQTIDDFTGNPIQIGLDGAVTDKRSYLFTLQSTFVTWLLSRILPSGGTTSQVLKKSSNTNYDVAWSNDTDEMIKVSVNDTTPGYLSAKLVAGSGITVTEVNDGGNETYSISAAQPSGIKVFYVDGNNANDGDGSILNPFRTLDIAYDAVVGTGTSKIPQFGNLTIDVAGYEGINYSTNKNLVIGTVSWNFRAGAKVEYTGTDYLYDLTSTSLNNNSLIEVTGDGDFITSSGGLIRVVGIASSSSFLRIFFSCGSLSSGTLDITKPMVDISGLNGFYPHLISFDRYLTSVYTDAISVYDRGGLNVNGSSQGFSTMGVNVGGLLPGTGNGGPDKKILKCNQVQNIKIENCKMLGVENDYYIELDGVCKNVEFNNISFSNNVSASFTSVKKIMRFGSTFSVGADGAGSTAVVGIFMYNSRVEIDTFSLALVSDSGTTGDVDTTSVITNISGGDVDKLYMNNCIFTQPFQSNINIAKSVSFKQNTPDVSTLLPVYNIIANQITFSNLPTVAPTQTGSLWNDAGTIKIV